ncbi:phage tail sheath family protein [Streptomyces capitiformicae]|uniref:phage tail sheath family protein n=1 Tax=Streptomyces capitiformicae TaxID=2014920 RepID=UPI0027E54FD7|nr:phage tail sheath subtilisin-like domain-containing protein [Streptomyces capitiformicae]
MNEATVINSLADYDRVFGGLYKGSTVSFAVRDFFANGGGQAVVVRLVRTDKSDGEKKPAPAEGEKKPAPAEGEKKPAPAVDEKKPALARLTLKPQATTDKTAKAAPARRTLTEAPEDPKPSQPPKPIVLQATDVGAWANDLRATVDHDTPPMVAKQLGVEPEDLFNLVVRLGDKGPQEVFRNVTAVESSRRVDAVLLAESQLVRVDGDFDPVRPDLIPDHNSAIVDDPDKGEDGAALEPGDYFGGDTSSNHEGLYALDHVDLFNLLCIPPPTLDGNTDPGVYQAAQTYCAKRRAVLIVDPPKDMTVANAVSAPSGKKSSLDNLELTGEAARNSVLYFPRLMQPDPTDRGRIGTFVGCGAIAGVIARTDATRGVWKAPAGVDATLTGISGLEVNLTDAENGMLNPHGINCLRTFPGTGTVLWGARTLRGADHLGDEYKYLPVRRLALHIEESLFRGTQWVVFEPNDEPLWAQIRLNLGAFMHNLFRQGAFHGTTARDAYFVKCDRETTTPNDVNAGQVNIVVGFAPVRPAEFVVLQIQQIAQAQA